MREVLVQTGEGRHLQRIDVGPHRLAADEPEKLGGSDGGPTPHELLAAALGACKSMTMRMYAERKGWALRRCEVRVAHHRDGDVYRLDCTIALEGDLDAEQRQRLVEIADRCPVHRTLTGDVHVRSTLAG